MISPSVVLTWIDRIDVSFRNADALARQTILLTMPGALPASSPADNLNFILAVGKASETLGVNGAPDTINNAIYGSAFAALNAFISGLKITGVSTLDQYAASVNATPFTFLVGPNAANLYWLFISQGLRTPSYVMTAGNVFAPVTAFGTATVGSGGAITFAAGSSILAASDTTGGVQGYAPAKGAVITGTTLVNGTLTVQVTYSGQSSAGVPFTGHSSTINIDNLAVGATMTYTPPSGERISQITAVSASGSPSAMAGAFSIASQIERVTS